MQTLMHNAMAGFDVQKDMQAFERDLPNGFREKFAKVLYEVHGVPTEPVEVQPVETKREARLTVLRAVATGEVTPDQALEVLFANDD